MNRTTLSLSLLLLAAALSACRQRDETVAGTTGAAPLIVPATPTSTAPVTATVDPLPVTAPPPATAPTGPGVGSDAGVRDAGVRDAATADAAGGTDAGRTDAGTGAQKAQACFERCAASLQSCIVPSATDGGLPTFKDPAQCRAAADACRAACAP